MLALHGLGHRSVLNMCYRLVEEGYHDSAVSYGWGIVAQLTLDA